VAELVRHGMTNRRIAERMGVSLDAVKFHVANALSKLGFAGREQLRLWGGSPGTAPFTRSGGLRWTRTGVRKAT
jgi:DNA-binding NarL/FixJ family response regulator